MNQNKPFQIVVLSGKGGTGKSTMSLALADLMKPVVLADCDVDAADLFIIAQPVTLAEEAFAGGTKAEIDQNQCIACGKCFDLCRFDAITNTEGLYFINEHRCEGCGLCKLACPADAITMKESLANRWFSSDSRFGPMLHARLAPGEDNSGKLVTQVREEARKKSREKGIQNIIIDGPPGIGCPVIAALTGVDMVLLVTEPSMSGLSDLTRVYDLILKFGMPAFLIINRADVNKEMTEKIRLWANEMSINILGEIPFDRSVVDSMIEKKTLLEFEPNAPAAQKIIEIHHLLQEQINKLKSNG